MNAQANIRLKALAILEQLLASNNEALVDSVGEFLNEQTQNSEREHFPDGNELHLDELKSSLREAEEDFKAGRTKTHEAMKAKYLNGR